MVFGGWGGAHIIHLKSRHISHYMLITLKVENPFLGNPLPVAGYLWQVSCHKNRCYIDQPLQWSINTNKLVF